MAIFIISDLQPTNWKMPVIQSFSTQNIPCKKDDRELLAGFGYVPVVKSLEDSKIKFPRNTPRCITLTRLIAVATVGTKGWEAMAILERRIGGVTASCAGAGDARSDAIYPSVEALESTVVETDPYVPLSSAEKVEAPAVRSRNLNRRPVATRRNRLRR